MTSLELSADRSSFRRFLRALLDGVFGRARVSANWPTAERQQPSGARRVPGEPCPNRTSRRLAENAASLECLDAERKPSGDKCFGKTRENRIIWSELIDLELQEIDDQLDRIRGAGDQGSVRS